MKNLLNFEDFVNESNKVNETFTVTQFIQFGGGDEDEWTIAAQNCLKYLKIGSDDAYWITSEDDDEKFDAISDFWSKKSKSENITKMITGDNEGLDGRGSAFYGDSKLSMIKYEASGIDTFVIPINLYKRIK
jgi:hypothetical protein